MPIGSLTGFRKIFAVEEVPDATSHDVEEGFEAQVAKLWRTVSDKRKHLFQAEGFNLFRRRKKKPEWGPAGALGFGCGVGVGVGLTGNCFLTTATTVCHLCSHHIFSAHPTNLHRI